MHGSRILSIFPYTQEYYLSQKLALKVIGRVIAFLYQEIITMMKFFYGKLLELNFVSPLRVQAFHDSPIFLTHRKGNQDNLTKSLEDVIIRTCPIP